MWCTSRTMGSQGLTRLTRTYVLLNKSLGMNVRNSILKKKIFTFPNTLSVWRGVPSLHHFLPPPQKKIAVTLIQNNSVVLGLSVKIIKYMDSQIFGFSVLLVLTVRAFPSEFLEKPNMNLNIQMFKVQVRKMWFRAKRECQ